MTTYSGRSASYLPGKEVVNKEPPVSRYVVEKLYRVHRERVMKVEKTIDTRIVIPDFLLNREWKKNSEKQKQKVILQENQEIYKRIAKLEDNEGHMAKDNREHIRRMSSKLDYLRRLKEHGRLVNLIKIQKENEYMLKRLEKAKPQYTLKKCKDWYKHHELYKLGRRSDPTAGHIMHGMSNLLPSSLPPMSTITTKLDDETLTTLLDSKRQRKQLPSLDSSSIAQHSLATNSVLSLSTADRRSSLLSKSSPSVLSTENNAVSTRKFSHQQGSTSRKESRVLQLIEEGITEEDSPKRNSHQFDSSPLIDHAMSFRSVDGSEDGTSSEADFSLATIPFNHEVEVGSQQLLHVDDMILLASRPFPLPTESKNCLVQIYCSREYDENVRIVVIPPGAAGFEKLGERVITIDHAYDLVHASGHSSQLMHSTDQDDLQTLSDFLINMFKEADIDGSGSLTFDEFQALMEQVELGISPQELRFVISEADENENGVVDYEEFVPLAVDLIQSFRARNRAKTISSQQDVLVDDQILQTISSSELAMASKVCLEKLMEYDKKNYGLIRVSEFKRCLGSISASVGLLESEINLLSQLLPRDQFNRLKYNSSPNSFYEHLSKVRFMTMKNAMIESQGSGLQKYLLELCKEEEKKHDEENMKNSRGGDQKTAPPGYIPCRSLINILTHSPRLSLSRLQVLVIMSEASVLDGYINYYQFIPVVTKAIELMFEPKALRQRAELIARTDLSPEALLLGMGMSQEAFEERLLTLFKSYDIDHNGTLDQNEFIACLESLELQLTKGEMVALMATADVAQHGFLGFEDFVKFFSHNLLHLEREKRIRLLQSSLDQHSGENQDYCSTEESSLNGSSLNGSTSMPQKDLGQQLMSIFELSDPNRTGFITYEDFESILKDFSMHSSPFLMDLLRSELHTATVDTGKVLAEGEHPEQIVLVDYGKSLATCADLFSVYRAKESAWMEHQIKEEEATIKAQQIAQTQVADIHRISRYLLRRMKAVLPTKVSDVVSLDGAGSVTSLDTHIAESTVFLVTKSSYSDLQSVVRAPQAGLSRSEANIVLHRLLGASFAIGTETNTPDIHRTPRHLQHSITDRAVSLSPRPDSANIGVNGVLTFRDSKPSSASGKFSEIPQHISSRDIFEAVFEARRTTIMRTLLQPIDNTQVQQRVFRALESVWKADHPEQSAIVVAEDGSELLAAIVEQKEVENDDEEDQDIPRDVYGNVIAPKGRPIKKRSLLRGSVAAVGKYLSVDKCYIALETINGLPVSRAQLMFVIAAADCYDKTGTLLDIVKLADHIGSIFSQLIGADNIATRGAVVTQGHVDDRKALHGLKDTQLLRHLKHQLMDEAERTRDDNGEEIVLFSVNKLCQLLRDTQRLQLTDRDIITVVAVCGLSSQPQDVDLRWTLDACDSLLATVVDCVVALCRERMIHRRLSLCHTTFDSVTGTASGLMNEDGRKTLKALAEKLLYVVKLHPSDSVTQEEARRFSGLDTAEYFYPLRVGLPGDAKLLRQNATLEDASSPLFPSNRRHHHHFHRLKLKSRELGSADGGGDRLVGKTPAANSSAGMSSSSSVSGAAVRSSAKSTPVAAQSAAAASSADQSPVVVVGVNTKETTDADNVSAISVPADHANQDAAALYATSQSTVAGEYDDDDFEDDPDVALMVLFKGAVFLPARIPIAPAPVATVAAATSLATTTHKGSQFSRKASADTMGILPSSPELSQTTTEESRPSSSFSRRLQSHVQQSSTGSNANNSTGKQPQTTSASTPSYRTTQRGVLLQIVALDNGGGLSLYSTSGSGLIAQAVSPDGSLVVPCVSLPLRLPSIGAVDKEAAEQFVTNILDRLYLEQSVPVHASSLSAGTKQTNHPLSATVRAASALNLSINTNPLPFSAPTTGPTWTLKVLDDEEA